MSTPINDQTLRAFFQYLTNIANKLRDDAGYSGSHSDGGAGALLAQINVFKAGMERRIPKEWESDYNKFTATQDPEYAEYVRLTKKFHNRGV